MAAGRKISIRFFNDREVRAVWHGENARWYLSVLDIAALLRDQDD
jgi:cell filamentation protein